MKYCYCSSPVFFLHEKSMHQQIALGLLVCVCNASTCNSLVKQAVLNSTSAPQVNKSPKGKEATSTTNNLHGK